MGARLRTGVAVLALLGLLAALAAGVLGRSTAQPVLAAGPRMWVLAVPLLLAVVGLVLRRGWGRWAGLGVGIAVLPWATVVTMDLRLRGPVAWASLAAALLLLLSLSGKAMIGQFEGRAGTVDWLGDRMQWLRWAMICNLASVFGLLVFLAAYEFRFGRHVGSFLALMVGLLLGVLLLARQKTAGLLLVWLCCLLIVPAGILFVRASTSDPAEMALIAVAFLPGLVTGWATAFVFGRPVWRFLRS